MWLIYTLSGVLLSSILSILFRVLAKESTNPRALSFVFNVTVLVATGLLMLPLGLGKIILTKESIALIILSGLGYGLFQRYQFIVRRYIEASDVQIIFTSSLIVGYILSVAWLGETVTLPRFMGFIIIIASTILISKKPNTKLNFNRYAVLAFLIGSGLSIAATVDRKATPMVDSILTYSFIIWLIQSFVTFLPYISFDSLKKEIKNQRWLILLIAIINLALLLFHIAAIRIAPATQVNPVAASNVVVITLLSAIFLKERDRLWLKVTCSLLAMTGLVLISV